MGNKQIIETIYGKYHKFDIVKDAGGVFGSPTFYIYKDGKQFRGPYSSLADAVDVAKSQG